MADRHWTPRRARDAGWTEAPHAGPEHRLAMRRGAALTGGEAGARQALLGLVQALVVVALSFRLWVPALLSRAGLAPAILSALLLALLSAGLGPLLALADPRLAAVGGFAAPVLVTGFAFLLVLRNTESAA